MFLWEKGAPPQEHLFDVTLEDETLLPKVQAAIDGQYEVTIGYVWMVGEGVVLIQVETF